MKLQELLILLLLYMSVCWVSGFTLHRSSLLKPTTQRIDMKLMRERKCDITGRRRNARHNDISKSKVHTRRVQNVNLHWKKFWWEEGHKYVRLRIAARTIKTILKNGLTATAKKYGINLNNFAISGRDPTNKAGKAPHKPSLREQKYNEMLAANPYVETEEYVDLSVTQFK